MVEVDMHLIVGAGNLGLDLEKKFKGKNQDCFLVSRSGGFKYPFDEKQYAFFQSLKPSYVWVTVGAGSVEQAKENFRPFLDLHIALVVDLLKNLPKASITAFSSDYALEGNSLYALSKKWLEDVANFYSDASRLRVVRVGSLYGVHKPQNCFPGKLFLALERGKSFKFPSNAVVPTPTEWVADVLTDKFEHKHVPVVLDLAPSIRPTCTVYDWGKLVLTGEDVEIEQGPEDLERPDVSCLGNDFQLWGCRPNWLELWNKYGDVPWKKLVAMKT
jgi:hypothetical protein